MKLEGRAAGLPLFLGLGVTCAAHAKTYDFSISTAAFAIEGDVATSLYDKNVQGYDVTSVSGFVTGKDGGKIDGLAPNPSVDLPYIGGAGNMRLFDSVPFPDSVTVVDTPEILHSAGGYDYKVYTVETTHYISTNNPTAGEYDPGEAVVSGTVTAVPELQTWAMMGMGFMGVGLAMYGRTKKSRVALAA